MHTETSSKILEWNYYGRKRITYTSTMCGQYYALKVEGLWKAGRVMFGRDIDYRVSFPSLASARAFLQEKESNTVYIIGDPIESEG
jgi:hypothetical protein